MEGRHTNLGGEVTLESIIDLVALTERGREQALLSGVLESQPDDVGGLTAYAQAVARDTQTQEFDPSRYEQDRLRANDHDRVNRLAAEAYIVEAHARGAVAASERALAAAGEPGPEPAVDWFIILTAIIVMTTSFAPTIHDRVFLDIGDAISAWIASFLTGGFVATFIVSMMTFSIPVTGGLGVLANAAGAFAGVGFGIAACVLRWSLVESPEGRLTAIGMTLIEVFAVGYLEWLALSMRDRHREWKGSREAYNKLLAIRDVDRQHLLRSCEATAALQTQIDGHVRYVESRWIRKHKANDIERMAIDAVVNGYLEGIAQNRGFTRGLRRVS